MFARSAGAHIFGHEFNTAFDRMFPEQRRDMITGRIAADIQVFGDLLIGAAL